MSKFIGTLIVLILVAGVAYPFAQDAYQRYLVSSRLDAVLDARERAQFHDWKGDAASFARTLYDRCERTQGQGAVQCDRYRFAYEQQR